LQKKSNPLVQVIIASYYRIALSLSNNYRKMSSMRCDAIAIPGSNCGSKQKCAGAGVQESTPAGVSVYQQESRSRTRSRYFWLEQKSEQEQKWF